jgi:hypothetical protein
MNIGGKRIRGEMRAAAQERLSRLREMSPAEIERLPEAESAKLQILGEPAWLAVYRAQQASGETLVVVQAGHDRWFGITTEIEAVGFVALPSGEKVDASEEMLWEYA